MKPQISILVRARNDVALIRRTLDAIFSQRIDLPFEVIVCDDGSTDGTAEILDTYGDRIRRVTRPEGAYRPAKTLNALIAASQGEFTVFNNSDAIPLDDAWLANLLVPLREGCADVVFANQLPRPDATWLVKKDSWRAFGDGKIAATWRFFFSLASAAARRDDLVANPFDPNLTYSEDVEWAHRRPALRIAYVPEARVEHSHNYTHAELRKRFRGEGTADAAIFGGKPPSFARAAMGACAEALRDIRFLLPHPTGWAEMFGALPRRWIQRMAHREGFRSACVSENA